MSITLQVFSITKNTEKNRRINDISLSRGCRSKSWEGVKIACNTVSPPPCTKQSKLPVFGVHSTKTLTGPAERIKFFHLNLFSYLGYGGVVAFYRIQKPYQVPRYDLSKLGTILRFFAKCIGNPGILGI